VLQVKELVFYGLGEERDLDSISGGTHLEPKDYHEKLSQASSDTVVIDVRNAYESDIGRFGGQVRRLTRW
jgi:predicted sulfurtransferase